jgi:hypothetical protein
MRLFGYIVAFAYGIRDDERTIWHQACWGKGGPQHEAHAHWRRGGLTVVARTAAVLPKEEEVPVPQGPAIIVSPGEEVPPEEEEVLAPPFMVPPEEEVLQVTPVMVSPEEEEVQAPLSRPRQMEGDALSGYRPWLVLCPSFFSQKHRRFISSFFLINTVDL